MLIDVLIGYDRSETVAFHVAAHSIIRRSSVPVSITGLILGQLPLVRPRESLQSTDFAFSRFLVPYLRGYEGWSIFLDCDMLCRGDFAELLKAGQREGKAVSVVKHCYTPKSQRKFLDQPQTTYEKKNWSSVMVFNNEKCKSLTPDYVNTASGLELHQFKWIPEDEIGSLPTTWNHLVGEYDPNPHAKLVHFTLGTPCFEKYSECEFASDWYEEKSLMLHHERRGEYSRPERSE